MKGLLCRILPHSWAYRDAWGLDILPRPEPGIMEPTSRRCRRCGAEEVHNLWDGWLSRDEMNRRMGL